MTQAIRDIFVLIFEFWLDITVLIIAQTVFN